ncbi:TadG family pilus assembly protein [Frateuria aurantia]
MSGRRIAELPASSLGSPPRHQAGAMAVLLMLTLIGLVVILGSTVIGYLYWLHRDTQKIADLAALAGAGQLGTCSSDGSDNSAARTNAFDANQFGGTATIQCGVWTYDATTGAPGFTAGNSSATNAVKVVATHPALPWRSLGTVPLPVISATAIASGAPPVASFSVTPALATLNNQAPLGQLLQAVGLDPSQLDLVSYNGLANLTVTPSGLLAALGIDVPVGADVGTLNTLLDTKVGLSQLLNAEVSLAGQDSLLAANANLISAIEAQLGVSNLMVQLGSTATTSGLFALLQAPDSSAQAALGVQVNALQLLATSIGVASGQHAVSVGANATTLNLGLLQLTAAASVIEPPSIGIGGVGTTANSAQIRVFLHLQSGTGSLASSVPLLGSLVSALINLQVDIPIAIDVVQAMGTLTDLCDPDDPATQADGIPRATIQVNANILQTCIGDFTEADAFSTVSSCASVPGASTNKQLLTVGTGTLLGSAQLLGLDTHMVISALPSNGSVDLAAGQSGTVGNSLLIGDTVSNLTNALLGALVLNAGSGSSNASCNSAIVTTTCYQLAEDIWNSTASGNALYAVRLSNALSSVSTASSGLTGFIGGTLDGVLGLLGGVLTLNPSGVVDGLGTVLDQVGSLVTSLTCTLGIEQTCISTIATTMAGSSANGTANVVPVLLGYLLEVLQPLLNAIGSAILTPLLQDVLGLNLGVTTVNLQSLQCHSVHLVY